MPKSRKTSEEKKLKDPNAPKRPKSSYLFFCEEKRSKVKEANPDMKATEVTKELGRMWREEVSEKEKKKYEKKAETAREEYKEAMSEYVRPSDEELEKLTKKKKTRSTSGEKKGEKKKRDPEAPKRPTTAYLYFCKEMREKVKEDNEDMDSKEITRELGRMWREDYSDDRERWVELAEKDKKRYEEEMTESESEKSESEKSESGSEEESVSVKTAKGKKTASEKSDSHLN